MNGLKLDAPKIGRVNIGQFDGVISNVTVSRIIKNPKLSSKRGRFGLRKRSRRTYIIMTTDIMGW
jgi:hypothetical protein